MTSKTKKTLLLFTAMLFCSSAVFAVPAPGGKARIGTFNSPMAHSRVTSNVKFPYPTNRWFGSIFTTHAHHPYSFKMSPSPWVVNLNTNPSGAASGMGYLLGYPSLSYSADVISNSSEVPFIARILAMKQPGNTAMLTSDGSLMDSYSDWSSTFIVQDKADSTKWMKTTIGKGFIFTYNEYSADLNPRMYAYNYTALNKYYDLAGNEIPPGTHAGRDCILVKIPEKNNRAVYYAIYAPENATFIITVANSILDINFTSSERYLSIALVTAGTDDATTQSNAVAIFNDYRQYAYNFITDTKVSYAFDKNNAKVTTMFNFTTTAKRSGAGFLSGTVFALFPHQWKNSPAVLKPDTYNFKALRGVMKVGTGSSFTTENKFNGILPNLTYEVPDSQKSKMQGYIDSEKGFSIGSVLNPDSNVQDTYYAGKALSKAANLIPVFHQFGDTESRNRMIGRLKTELQLWYTYSAQSSKYFGYDTNWGGLIGKPNAFGSEDYADHHFHYGYFIYASAILALFDTQFAESSEYKGMVDLLVKDIYNSKRNDSDFPFLRNFDVYEGHSWANGAGGGDDRGIDQESSSEAMNAWAGIYLWGMATNNQSMMDLGAYGYTTEYQATKEYYLDISGEIYGGTPYAHKGIGILWDNQSEYYVHWRYPYTVDPSNVAFAQEVQGIQILPLSPSMLYHGYDTSFAQSFYSSMLAETNSSPGLWKDIWLRYKSLFDAPGALSDFIAGGFAAEVGSSLTYSFQFINFFNAYGTVDTSIVADSESFCVMNKSGQKSYIAFNSSTDTYKTVSFKSVSGGASAGSMQVPPMTTAVTKDFLNFKYDSLRTMHTDSNNYFLLMNTYSDAATVTASTVPVIDSAYYKTIPFAFTVNSPAANLDNVPGYVKLSGITIPSGFSASQIKVAVYNTETNLPDRVYPSQNIKVESESGGVATVLIDAIITRTGTYVLVIPTGVLPADSKLISGTLKSVKDGSNVAAAILVYNTVDKSTTTELFNGTYAIEVITGSGYTITPTSDNFAFEPVNYSFTVSGSDITKDFSALPKYLLAGTVLLNGRGMDKIKINIYDNTAKSTSTVTTATGGKYSDAIYYGRSYTVTPFSSEYDFISEYIFLNNVQDSFLNADFYAQIAAGRFVVYPNPYKPSKYGHVGITFTGLKSGAEIKIYNIAGELVFDKKAHSDGPYTWYAENNSGYQIGSGVYIYHIKSSGKVQKGKLAVER